MNGPDVEAALWATIELLDRAQTPHMLMGALSLGFYREGRSTHDVDLQIAGDAVVLDHIKTLARDCGFSVDELWEQYHPDVRDVQIRLGSHGVAIDVMLPRDAHDRSAFARRRLLPEGERMIWVVSCEDLILQKLKAGRPRDFDDVIPLFARHRDSLDHAYVNQWALRLGVREELDYLWSESERVRKP